MAMNKNISLLLIFLAAGSLLFAQTAPYDLEELMLLAEKNNPTLGRQRLAWEQALAGENRARAEKGPRLTGMMSYSYLALPPEGVTLEAGELGTLPLNGTMVPLPSEDLTVLEDGGNNYYQMGLTLTQPLYTWGKLELARKAAAEGARAEEEAFLSMGRQVRTELKTLLATLDVLDSMEENLNGQEEIIPRLIEIVRESYRKGFLLETDLLEAQLSAREVDVAARELAVNRENTLRRIARLTGEEISEKGRLDYGDRGAWDKVSLLSLDGDVLSGGLLRDNGELKQLGAALEAEKYREEGLRRKKAALPDMGFQLDLAYADDIPPLSDEAWSGGGVTANATVILSGTLFDGGRNRYDWEEARSAAEARALQYGEAAASLNEELQKNLAELDLIKARIAYEEGNIEKSGQRGRSRGVSGRPEAKGKRSILRSFWKKKAPL